MQIELTEPQLDFVMAEEARPGIVGGLGSGKSRAGTMRIIKQLMSTPGANGAYYMPTYDLLRLRAMPGVEEDLTALGLAFTVNKSEYTITIIGFGFIIFRSYDRPERIVAYEVADSIVDEIDTLPKEKAALVWRKINERNRQQVGRLNTIGVVTTPDQGIHGFVYDRWVKQAQPGYKLIKAPTWSNPYLPDDYIDQIRANYDPKLADLYIEGEFVSLSDSKIYHFFNRETHNTDREMQPGERLHIGLDFNIGGCCAVVFVIDGVDPIAVDEFVSHDTQDFVNNLAGYKGHKIVVYPDSSGGNNSTNAAATDLDIIRQGGFSVNAPNKNPFVRDRINAFNKKLSKSEIKVNCKKCPEFAFALESHGYNNKGEPEKFSIHPAIDDWTDAPGYFIHRKYPLVKPMINKSGRVR